jgi:hypothetical protein
MFNREVRLAPATESSFEKRNLVRACIFKHPSDSCSSHSETRFIDDNGLLSRKSHVSESLSEIVLELPEALTVCSGNEVMEQVCVNGSGNMGSNVRVS